jgi:dienelactone hydrolase
MGVVHGRPVCRIAVRPRGAGARQRVGWQNPAVSRAATVTAGSLRFALAALLAIAAACTTGDGNGDPAAGGGPAGAGAGGEANQPAPGPPFAVGHRTMTLVDATRPTAAVPDVQPAVPDRTIEVDVVYPAEGDPAPDPDPASEPAIGGTAVDDARPAEGAFPLVVFAHGFEGRGDAFLGFAERWARAGYVVALPTFPLSREGLAVAQDLANQPADVSFVIDSLVALDDGDPLAGHVDAENIAVGGHSLGAATVFGVAYNACCTDERIDATIPVAGGTLPFEGSGEFDWPDTPMLLVHGVRDATVPIAVGDAMYDLARGPVWYLRPAEADHGTVFAGAAGRLFNDATIAFLDAELRGDDELLDAMADEVAASGVAEWRVRE